MYNEIQMFYQSKIVQEIFIQRNGNL